MGEDEEDIAEPHAFDNLLRDMDMGFIGSLGTWRIVQRSCFYIN